jgi:hypothetical protein
VVPFCESGWIETDNACVKLFNQLPIPDGMNSSEALEFCGTKQAKLATIKSIKAQTVVNDLGKIRTNFKITGLLTNYVSEISLKSHNSLTFHYSFKW